MITRQLLQRYFNDECTPEEQQHVARWLQDDTADHSLLQYMMEDQWDAEKGSADGEQLKDMLLHDLRQQLYPEQASVPVSRSIRRTRWLWYSAATSAAAALLICLWLWHPVANKRPAVAIAALAQWDTILNNEVQKKRLVLPDSTKVWLAPGSRLVYPRVNDRSERVVKLEGQAFFDVAHDSSRPFIVHSGTIQTRVLGTAFNVEAYGSEKEIRISLVRGRVAVQSGHHSIAALQAGEMLTYTKADSSAQKNILKITGMDEWTSGRMVFNDVLVSDALERLARQYRLAIHYDQGVKLTTQRFSTVFDRETPEQIIQNILFITNYRYRLQGSKLTIMQ